jgi:hypothetical protein
MTAKKSAVFWQPFLNHRAVCEKCFFYSLTQRDAPLCAEGKAMQEKFLPLWDAEGSALMAIGKNREGDVV